MTDARAYHSIINAKAIEPVFNHISELIKLSFSARMNETHENMDEEKLVEYELIHFLTYFELGLAWSIPSNR